MEIFSFWFNSFGMGIRLVSNSLSFCLSLPMCWGYKHAQPPLASTKVLKGEIESRGTIAMGFLRRYEYLATWSWSHNASYTHSVRTIWTWDNSSSLELDYWMLERVSAPSAACPMVIVGQMETPKSWVEVTLCKINSFQNGYSTKQTPSHGPLVLKEQVIG